jgi:hypothetical protein
MRRNRDVFLILALVIGMLVTLAPGIWAHTKDVPFITNLYAGTPFHGDSSAKIVGEVRVWNDAANLHVQYLLSNGEWELVSTHLHVALSLAAIPQTGGGNPKVGQFQYSRSYDPGVHGDEFEIPNSWGTGAELYIAAHAVVRTQNGFAGDVCSLASTLPGVVPAAVQLQPYHGPIITSYFGIEIFDDSILSSPLRHGWCIDTDHNVLYDFRIDFNVYLPYPCITEPPLPALPEDAVEYPENLDLVNWIINQAFEEKQSPSTGEFYTYGDVQWAIWKLIDDNIPDAALPNLRDWDEARAMEIVTAAVANGEGFVPGCGQKVAIILFSPDIFPFPGTNENRVQTLLIEVPVPCVPSYRDETAWAGNGLANPLQTFPGSSWALYFNYVIQ